MAYIYSVYDIFVGYIKKFPTVATFVILNLQITYTYVIILLLLGKVYASMFMIYLRIKFRMHISNDSLITATNSLVK
jgi:hypothetical protein